MLLFKKWEYLGVVTPGMPGLQFWFCVPERDQRVSPFILARGFSDFNKLLILLQLQKFRSRKLI